MPLLMRCRAFSWQLQLTAALMEIASCHISVALSSLHRLVYPGPSWQLTAVPAPGNTPCRRMCDRRSQGLGIEQLRVLTALPRLAVLNLEFMTWAEDAINMGPTLLAANMPHLRVLNTPYRAQVRTALFAGVLPLSFATLLKLPEQVSVKCMKSSARM